MEPSPSITSTTPAKTNNTQSTKKRDVTQIEETTGKISTDPLETINQTDLKPGLHTDLEAEVISTRLPHSDSTIVKTDAFVLGKSRSADILDLSLINDDFTPPVSPATELDEDSPAGSAGHSTTETPLSSGTATPETEKTENNKSTNGVDPKSLTKELLTIPEPLNDQKPLNNQSLVGAGAGNIGNNKIPEGEDEEKEEPKKIESEPKELVVEQPPGTKNAPLPGKDEIQIHVEEEIILENKGNPKVARPRKKVNVEQLIASGTKKRNERAAAKQNVNWEENFLEGNPLLGELSEEVKAIQTTVTQAQAGNEESTAQILQNALIGLEFLKNRVPDGNGQLKVHSHLEKNSDGSYKIEVYKPDGSEEIRYKIKATYTITLTTKDAHGKEQVVRDDKDQPVQVTVKRDIFIKTFVKSEDVPFLASQYKDTIVQLAEKNSSRRLEQYDANTNDALIKQHDFTFSLSKDPQTGLKALKSISTTIPAVPGPGGAAAHSIELKLKSKAVKNMLYVRNPLDTASDKRKIKRQENVDVENTQFVSGKSIYRTKEEALQRAAEYTIEDPKAYAHFIEKDLEINLIRIEDEVQKKQEELKALEATFKTSRYLGFGSKNTPEFEKFLTETFSQKAPDDPKWENNQTKYLKLRHKRQVIDTWNGRPKTNALNGIAAIEAFFNGKNHPAISPELQQDINQQQLTALDVKQQMEVLKVLKQDLTQSQKDRIDAIIALADDQTRQTALSDNTNPVNAEIQAALNSQEGRIKHYMVLQKFKHEIRVREKEEQDLKMAEAQYQAKRDLFNSKLIRLEKAQQDLNALATRLETLRAGAEAGLQIDPNEAKHQLVLKDITEKKINELHKQATHYDELIEKLHKEFLKAGAEDISLPPAGVNVGDKP